VAQASAVASDYKVKDGPNDAANVRASAGSPTGFRRRSNEQAARASNGGALPPTVADCQGAFLPRGFPQFVFGLLHQFQEQDELRRCDPAGLRRSAAEGFQAAGGSYYNKYFPGTPSRCRNRCRTTRSPMMTARRRSSTSTPGCLDLLMWTRRAAHGRPQAPRPAGDYLHDHLRRADVFHQRRRSGQRALSVLPNTQRHTRA